MTSTDTRERNMAEGRPAGLASPSGEAGGVYINCHTAFSYKYGTMPVQELFDEAKRCGVHKLVLTEINNTASYIEMMRICEKNKPFENNLTRYGEEPYVLDIAVGVEFRRENELLYIAIAKNNKGFEAINGFLSFHNRESKPLPQRAPELQQAFIIYPYPAIQPEQLRKDEFIGVSKHQLNHFSIQSSYRSF